MKIKKFTDDELPTEWSRQYRVLGRNCTGLAFIAADYETSSRR